MNGFSLGEYVSELNYLINRITYLRLVYNRTLKQLSKGAAVFSVAERVTKQQSNTVSCYAMEHAFDPKSVSGCS